LILRAEAIGSAQIRAPLRHSTKYNYCLYSVIKYESSQTSVLSLKWRKFHFLAESDSEKN